MAIIEKQILFQKNLLSYRSPVEDKNVFETVSMMHENINVLDLVITGDVIITKHKDDVEFLIPVNKIFDTNIHYSYKPEFKLVHAVKTRHFGKFRNISSSVDSLNSYIAQKSLKPITNPYYVIKDIEMEITDIFISVSENVL